MPNTISPNMGLVIPGVGTEPGPAWATDLNSSLTILDAHDHSPDSGVQITPSGLNINSDLPFNGNNQTLLRSSRYSIQSSPLSGILDLGCVYVSGVDLYFNDENGNQIQITKDGGIAGTSGSIANLTSPASASYVSGTSTFVWQSNTNTAANMDNGSVTIRKLTPSSPGITVAAPSSLSGDYTLTLPAAPPSVNSVLVMDNSGNVTTSAQAVDIIVTGSLEAGSSVTADTGDITATAGNIVATAGDLVATAGNISAPVGNLTVSSADVTGSGLVVTNAIVSNLEVFPTTTSNAKLIGFAPNALAINSVASSSSLAVVTGVSYSVPVMLAGFVDSAGNATLGANYTSVRNALGNYTVTYDSGIFDSGSVPVAIASPAGSTTNIAKAIVFSLSSTQAVIHMRDGGGSNVDGGFTFIVYGNRAA